MQYYSITEMQYLALSGGEQTDMKVNPSDEEVDAQEALAQIRNLDKEEWGSLW